MRCEPLAVWGGDDLLFFYLGEVHFSALSCFGEVLALFRVTLNVSVHTDRWLQRFLHCCTAVQLGASAVPSWSGTLGAIVAANFALRKPGCRQ